MNKEERRGGFSDTFLVKYVRYSPAVQEWGMFIFLPIALAWFDLSRLLLAFALVPAIMLVILVFNYLCWRTIGHLLTSATERASLSVDERAKLAWEFWMRPARKSKS